jgi:flagellar protein FliL
MTADESSPPAEASPSKIKQVLPFVLALVLGLAIGAGSGAFVVGPALAKGIAPAGAPVESHDAKAEHKGEKGDTDATKQVYTLDNLVLNPAESGGTRFLLLSVTFETTDAALVEDMKNRDAELRDAVLVTLGAKTVDQLADMRTRESIKAELSSAALRLFKRKSALRIYFPQFVIQ